MVGELSQERVKLHSGTTADLREKRREIVRGHSKLVKQGENIKSFTGIGHRGLRQDLGH